MKSMSRNHSRRPPEGRRKAPLVERPDRKEERQRRRLRQERSLDSALADTFPASDPVSSMTYTL
jgi:hypothetical protein